MPTDKQKKELAIGGGAAAVTAPFTPTKVRMPSSTQSRRAGRTAAFEGKSSVEDLRAAYRGMGGRLGNDSHTARLAQSMKEKVREDRPIELKRFRSGETMMVGGHHRVAAAEMIGLKELPTKVTESNAKHPYSVVPLYARNKYKRDVKAARQPVKQMTDEQIARVASKKTPKIHQSVNTFKSRAEEGITALKKPKVGVPVAIGTASIGGGLAYKNKDKIIKRESTNADLARAKRQQANLSTASAGLGAAALGTKGASFAITRTNKPKEFGPVTQKAAVRLARAHKLDKTSLGILTTAAGVGSISGLRFAHVQREEAKKIEKGLIMTNAFGVSHDYVLIEKGKHEAPSSPSTVSQVAQKGKVTLKAVGSKAKTFGAGHPYLTTAAIGAGIGGAVLAPGIMASESASRRRVKRTFSKGLPSALRGGVSRNSNKYMRSRAQAHDWGKAASKAKVQHATSHEQYYGKIARKQSRVELGKAKGFDPEARRERRQKVYGAAGLTTAAAAGYSAAKPAEKAYKQVKRTYDKGGAEKVLRLKTLKSKPVQQTLKRGGVAGAALLATGAVASQARHSGRRYNGWYS